MKAGPGAIDESGQHPASAGRPTGQIIQRGEVVLDELRAKDQVFWRVAGHRELREADQVGACRRRLGRREDHPFDVPLEVPDRRVDLAQCDPHHGASVTRVQPGQTVRFRTVDPVQRRGRYRSSSYGVT